MNNGNVNTWSGNMVNLILPSTTCSWINIFAEITFQSTNQI